MTDKEKAKELAIRWENNSMFTVYEALLEMARWKDKQFWSKENIERIITTYELFPDSGYHAELVKKTIEKLKPKNNG